MYAVVMYNDNYTPMEFVVYVLQSEFQVIGMDLSSCSRILTDTQQVVKGLLVFILGDIARTQG